MKERTKKETAWIDRLQKVLDAQPKTISGYCTGTRIHFFHGEATATGKAEDCATEADKLGAALLRLCGKGVGNV